MIDAAQLGKRLRGVREGRGLSQQAAAEALGLPRTAVTNMESGSRAVSTLELTRLAEIYGYPAGFFLAANEEPEAEELCVVLQRALPEMEHAPGFASAVRRLLDLYCEGAALRRMLDRTMERTVPSYAMRMTDAGAAIRQGETVAQEERRRLGLGNAPIGNIAECIAGRGIWTAAAELPDGLSGLFVNHPAVGLAILVNRRHWPVRRRFSYAHEYAHALFDRDQPVTATRRENASALMEKRANAFAAAFLMPPGGVAEQLAQIGKGQPSRQVESLFDAANNARVETDIRARPGSQTIAYQDVAVLARHFGVSFEAAVWRLQNLRHIGAKARAALIGQKDSGKKYIEVLGFRELLAEGAPPEASERELRSQLLRLAIEAFRQEEISRGRLLEIGKKLAIGRDQLIELAEAARRD